MPAVVVVTEVFEVLARKTARQLGLDDYPPLVVPHPIFNRDVAWMHEVVDDLVDAAVDALTGTHRPVRTEVSKPGPP